MKRDPDGDPMGAVCIILARSGSKGVPRKNMAVVGGRPCLAWTIEYAKAARTVSRIALSTDDQEMAALARAMQIEVVNRPPDLASDSARVDDAARHAVSSLSPSPHHRITAVTPIVLLYGNVPVRPPGLIDRAVALLREADADSVQSYHPVGKHHPWWTARLDERGVVLPWEGDRLNHGVFRRQDLPAAFIPDGAVIVVTKQALFLEVAGVEHGPHAFFGRDRRGITNQEGSVVDIDSPLDLKIADAMLRAGAAWSERPHPVD